MKLLIVNCIPEHQGWTPIQHLVSLAARLLEAEVVNLPGTHPSWTRKALAVIHPRRRSARASQSCLFVGAGAADLVKIANIAQWRHRFGFLSAWIIDSFWVDHMPRVIRLARPFDHFFVTSLEDVDTWRRVTRTPTTWLPWGSDVLDFGGQNQQRPWDLTRVGRQPPQWEDDQAAASAAEALGIRYRGRPQSAGLSTLQNFGLMMEAYRNTKYTLAFSNLVNSEMYTHPTRDYLTGRWVDSLACGSTVAGVSPRGTSALQLLWPGATLEFGSIERRHGLEVMASALQTWTPRQAESNYCMALQKLDWRWRLKIIAQMLPSMPRTLTEELTKLESRIGDCSGVIQ